MTQSCLCTSEEAQFKDLNCQLQEHLVISAILFVLYLLQKHIGSVKNFFFLLASILPFIHTSIFAGKQPKQDVPLPSYLLQLNLSSISWVYHGDSSQWDMLQTPHPGDRRCLLLMWRSSNSTLRPSQMTELLILSLRERPASLWRKLIFTLVSAVSFFRSLPRAYHHNGVKWPQLEKRGVPTPGSGRSCFPEWRSLSILRCCS